MIDIIKKANDAYYNSGESILTDQEFDLLADNGLEIENFRNKVQHVSPMGSLKKIKNSEEFFKWSNYKLVNVTPKLDGNSIEVITENGKPVRAITRGNGFIGNDVTNKILNCNLKLGNIPLEGTYSIKCEAIIPKKYHEKISNISKSNPRNICAGLLNKKEVDEHLKYIDVVSFEFLEKSFNSVFDSWNKIKEYFEYLKKEYIYEIDGLVCSLVNYIYDENDLLLPSNTLAIKFNKEGVEAEIGNIEWNLGKHGKITPVLILKNSVNIDGTNVQRISASNYSLLNAAGLWVGAKVKVIKSGDIIPYISEVIEKSNKIETIVKCPECGSIAQLDDNEVNMICVNSNCSAFNNIHLKHIFNIFDLEFISDSTIQNIIEQIPKVKTISDFFKLTEEDIVSLNGFGKRKAKNFISKLKNVFLTESQVLECALVKGISSSQSEKLIEHFGSIESFLYTDFTVDDIKEINFFGEVLAKTVIDNKDKFKKVFEELHDSGVNIVTVDKVKFDKKVVATGTHPTMKRSELKQYFETFNLELQDSVNKETTVVFAADPNGNSTKLKKAKQLGIQIISYEKMDEFLKKENNNGI